MAKKRGFLAELQHQSAQAQRQRQQAATAAAREQARTLREYDAARKQAERAQAQASKASAAEQKQAQAEAKRLYEAARQAEVESMNAHLASQLQDLDTLLKSTLDLDDFVDLAELRTVAEHPPFDRADLEVPLPPLVPVQAPPEPQFVEPKPPSGLGGVFGKKKHAEAVVAARAAFDRAHTEWEAIAARVPSEQFQQMQQHQAREQERQAQLAVERERYASECREREAQAAKDNEQLDDFAQRLARNEPQAVEEYISMVLANSVYPEYFAVEHDHSYDAELKELTIKVVLPAPEAMPSVKEHKYVKTKDEISATPLSAKDQKDRYANALHQTALRTLHEMFEADREGKIATITLLATTHALNTATGRNDQVDLLAVAVDRSTFIEFDLAKIIPSETLRLLKAEISKNPFGLVAIDGSKGVRG